MKNRIKYSGLNFILLISGVAMFTSNCNYKERKTNVNETSMKEKQITFEDKTHALDNNDNFSPDGNFLCYDTRGTVYNNNLANCNSIKKVEIETGRKTVLWEPPSVTGENAAPGVAAVSYHPKEDKVIFIHGPFLEEVEERGYYDIRNRTGKAVSADGKGKLTNIDMRDAAIDRPTTPGAQRGGTHRHEYSRDGNRIGFTYDDYLQKDYDRTIGYMEANENSPTGYSHYFTLLLKPAIKGESKAGEIEKAYSDSWVDKNGMRRAFIGKVRAENGIDYETSLFVAEIPEKVDITTSFSGDKDNYPRPPKGINIRRLTHSKNDDGIVRGSYDGKRIAYLSKDEFGIKQVFVIPTDGSDRSEDPEKKPKQITNYKSDASNIRWHITDDWVFSINNGNIFTSYVGNDKNFGKVIPLTNDDLERGSLVVSPDGDMLAYNIEMPVKEFKKGSKKEFMQIFVLDLDWDGISARLN